MRKFFYLLLLPLFCGLAACSSDDDGDGKITMSSIAGRWTQDDATLNGSDAYSLLHLKEGGTGHVVFKSKDTKNPTVTYDDITYTLSENVLTIIGSSIAGVYTVGTGYNTLILTNVTNSMQSLFAKNTYNNSLTKWIWKRKLTDSSIRDYLLIDFSEANEGTLTRVYNSAKETSDRTFTYTYDSENGPLTIRYDNGDTDYFFYAMHLGGNYLFFSRDSESSTVYYGLWVPSKMK